ncbi:MAG: hypothetical protein L3K52_09895 [Candidatus Thiothrix sulfatifontis]|nr:MAG: hypothetical protein L3K52_09895 [Candidatus Thiothrix sulfatifontis]
MEKRGGKRDGAGRKRGALNAATINVRELARQHTENAINALVELLNNPESPQRAIAANSLLDRGYGKPKVMNDADLEPIILRLKSGELTATDCALEISAQGMALPKIVELLALRELGIETAEYRPVNYERLEMLYQIGSEEVAVKEAALVGRGVMLEQQINAAKGAAKS